MTKTQFPKFHERLKSLREKQNKTLNQISADAGIYMSYLSDYEKGDRLPSLEIFRKLCIALNTSADFLLDIPSDK